MHSVIHAALDLLLLGLQNLNQDNKASCPFGGLLDSAMIHSQGFDSYSSVVLRLDMKTANNASSC